MDKIVKHRFWILLALVPPLVVFGYYKANGAIKVATETRKSALDTALNNVPDGKGPNPTWVKGADGGIELYNEAISKAVNVEKVRVWTDQLPRMTWPPEMEPFLPRTPPGDVVYRGEFAREATFTYKSEYNDQLEALYQSIEPLKREKDGGVSGKVQVSRGIIPRHTFRQMLVKSESIWDAQEDLWLLQLLFDSVRNANRPAENAAKSAVRQLNMIRLMGGDGQSTVRSAGGMAGGMADGMPEGRGGMMNDEDGPVGGMMNPMAMMGRGGMGMGQRANVNFDPSEEFGSGFEGMASSGSADGTLEEREMRDMDTPVAGGFGGVGGMGRKEIRYIQPQGELFRELAVFYMSVLIDQKKIADFLVELSNADWPIRIVRFNVGPNAGGTGGSAQPGYRSGMSLGRNEDTDASAFGVGGVANFDRGAAGGFGDLPPEDFGPGFGNDLFTNPLMGGDDEDPRMIGVGGAAGAYGPSPMVRGDQIQSLFTHPDLVQMDWCGVITMYNPPAPDLYAAVTGKPAADPAAAAPAADGTTAPAGEAATPAVAPADASAAQPATLGVEAVDPTGAAPEAGVSPDSTVTPETGAAPAEASDAPAGDAPAEASVPAPGA